MAPECTNTSTTGASPIWRSSFHDLARKTRRFKIIGDLNTGIEVVVMVSWPMLHMHWKMEEGSRKLRDSCSIKRAETFPNNSWNASICYLSCS
jgi:hypothetical protein